MLRDSRVTRHPRRRSAQRRAALFACLALGAAPATFAQDPDRDGDGLSDFQETHKYFTDPAKADSDSDGSPDGDWNERREFTYTIRSVLRVMPPVNAAEINDDYQDARVREKTARHYELEVIHYPLNTVHEAIRENPRWQEDAQRLRAYVAPGVTTNWDEPMRRELRRDLAADGIDLDALSDKQIVERVSAWILRRTKAYGMFNGFHVHYPAGRPEVVPGRERSVEEDKGDPSWTLQEQLEHELLGREMYRHRSRGTCTSTAVLMTTVLRAAGIPTRMILCTPMVDASGGDNLELVRQGITHHAIRELLVKALSRLRGSNASHTFNEVFVGGRWRRLNYDRLGQNILDRNLFGLITHVNTFNDLAETQMFNWGGRQPDEVFRYANAYTALEVSDQFGSHCDIANPPAPQGALTRLTISRVRWLAAQDLPEAVRASRFTQDGSGHLFLHADAPVLGADFDDYNTFYEQAAKAFTLEADGAPTVRAAAERGFWINSDQDCREFYVRIPPEELAKMKPGVAYRLRAAAPPEAASWLIAKEAAVSLPPR